MTFEKFQSKVDKMIESWGGYYDEMTNLGLIMEELGEVARVMTREFGEQKWKEDTKKEDLADELVDVIYAVTCVANQQNIDLEESIKKNFSKQLDRGSGRFSD